MSALIDRLICHREGHKPSGWIDVDRTTVNITGWITTCQRCGKAIKIKVSASGASE